MTGTAPAKRMRPMRLVPAAAAIGILVAGLAAGTPATAAPAPGPAPALVAGPASALRVPAPRPFLGWGLDRIDQRRRPLDGKYRAPGHGAGVRVYLVDTGLDAGNAEFGGRASIGTDLLGGTGADCFDEIGVGHGTFVAGIVGGARTGVANKVSLVAVKALGCGEGGTTLSPWKQRDLIVRAARWILRHGVRPAVVNMSLGVRHDARIDRAVRRLIDHGFPVVVAAGNDAGDSCRRSPARVGPAITVAASDTKDRSWRSSSFEGTSTGRCVDLYAPGKNITSVLAGGSTYRYAGVGATSWATPFVTGAVALRLQTHPGASPRAVTRWLLRHATRGVLHRVPPGTPNRLLYLGP